MFFNFFTPENEDQGAEKGGYNYRDMMRRDQRRWTRADQNGDNELSKEEFSDFLHPEEAEHMKDVIIEVGAVSEFSRFMQC